MDRDDQGGMPQADVHICIVRAGEPLYLPDTVNAALGLADGGSYAVVQINGMVVIAPQGPAADTACRYLQETDPCADGTMPDLLEQLDAVRVQIAGQVRNPIYQN
jgi:hypothetical protein